MTNPASFASCSRSYIEATTALARTATYPSGVLTRFLTRTRYNGSTHCISGSETEKYF
jgi:hypothetical protein